MDSAFRRKYGADDSLYMWNRFKQHHNFGESQTEEAKKLALSSSKRSDWATIAARIARDEPLEYGARHPCGPISRQGLMKLVQSAVRDATEVFVGRRRTLPENATNSIVSTLRKMLATHFALCTVPLLRPVALGIIAVEGYSHYLTEGGKGNFTFSKWWLSYIFREQKWSYRKPQTNSRKLPDNWKSLTFDMILRTVYFVRRYDIPEVLFVNADHIGIMHLQLKGGSWYAETGRGTIPEVQGYGTKNQITLLTASTARGDTLSGQVIFQGKTIRSLPNPLQYKPSTIPPAAGGKKKERAVGGSSKLTSSFVPDFTCLDSLTCDLFQGVGLFAVTHDHWAGINTSKSWVHDILVPHYRKCCASLGLVEGTQKCVLLVDCWWGWLDEEFREWVRGGAFLDSSSVCSS